MDAFCRIPLICANVLRVGGSLSDFIEAFDSNILCVLNTSSSGVIYHQPFSHLRAEITFKEHICDRKFSRSDRTVDPIISYSTNL